MIMSVVGFLTFGLQPGRLRQPRLRLQVNHVTAGYMIFLGVAYDLTQLHHPAAMGIPRRLDGTGANVLFDLPEKYGGMDGSFLFQNVNGKEQERHHAGAQLGRADGRVGQPGLVLPLQRLQQDGLSSPNLTIPYYLGYAATPPPPPATRST